MPENAPYPATIRSLLDISLEMPLKVTAPVEAGQRGLSGLTVDDLFEEATLVDPAMGDAVLAALWLRFDDLEASHEVVNRIENETGYLWHGILHRREGDYPNARYWVHRAGNHPIYPYLAQGMAAILANMESLNADVMNAEVKSWDSMYFVKICERAVEEGGDFEKFCQQVQDLEWNLLFNFCYQSATGVFG